MHAFKGALVHEWVGVSLCKWVCPCVWVGGLVSEQVSQRVREWVTVYMHEWVDMWACMWMSEWVHDRWCEVQLFMYSIYCLIICLIFY